MKNSKIGKVVHYYDKIGVAILLLSDVLHVGDKIKITKGKETFEQKVESMQEEHKPINNAVAGQEIGLKVDQPVAKGSLVYKVS